MFEWISEVFDIVCEVFVTIFEVITMITHTMLSGR